jgi:excisionase family DNA binding protein
MGDSINANGLPVAKLAYSTQEAALAIGQSEQTIRRLIKRGHLKACGVLRHKVIPATELQRFLRDSLGEVAE